MKLYFAPGACALAAHRSVSGSGRSRRGTSKLAKLCTSEVPAWVFNNGAP
jgi:hypothetical protein